MKWLGLPLAAVLGLVLAGCGSRGSSGSTPNTAADQKFPSTASPSTGGAKAIVAFAQLNSADPRQQVFEAETKAEADKHASEFTLQEESAGDDPAKQIDLIDTMRLSRPKVLLVSPAGEAVGAATDKAFDAGIPVVLLDGAVPGDKFTYAIGGDNVEIGRQAGNFIVSRLRGKGTVLMIQGSGGAASSAGRKAGAMEIFKKNAGITVIEGEDCKYQRQAAEKYVETFLQSGKRFDAVFAHSDEMAIGAYNAWDAWRSKTLESGRPLAKPLFVGVGGCQKEAIDMIKDGKLDATFKYPIPGPRAIQVAADLLKGKKPDSKNIVLPTELITKATADIYERVNPGLAK